MENWELVWTKLTSLDESSIDAVPENLQGVYRLSYKNSDGHYYVYYVGQSEDIKARLLQHLSDSDNVCIRNYVDTEECVFRYAQITQSYVRDAAEKQMYDHYAPSCNNLEPTGRTDVTINLN